MGSWAKAHRARYHALLALFVSCADASGHAQSSAHPVPPIQHTTASLDVTRAPLACRAQTAIARASKHALEDMVLSFLNHYEVEQGCEVQGADCFGTLMQSGLPKHVLKHMIPTAMASSYSHIMSKLWGAGCGLLRLLHAVGPAQARAEGYLGRGGRG